MSEDYRRHQAVRREIIFVPVPYEAGTVKETHRAKPPAYRRNQHQPWRPRSKPPNKAERVVRWLDQCRRQEEIVTRLRESPAARRIMPEGAKVTKRLWS
jgi:hypothetical protein